MKKNKMPTESGECHFLLIKWFFLTVFILIIGGVGAQFCYAHRLNNVIDDDEQLTFMMLPRNVEMGIKHIEKTPAWFKLQVLSHFSDAISLPTPATNTSFERKVKDYLTIKFVDLNKDKIPEVMVNYTGVATCGNKDCPTYIFTVLLEEKSLRKIGRVTPSSYKIYNFEFDEDFDFKNGRYFHSYVNGYKIISNCVYGAGGVELLVYSEIQEKYEPQIVSEKYHYMNNNGCRFFENKRLILEEEVVKEIFKTIVIN